MDNNVDSTEELSIREFQELVDPETAENEAWKKRNRFSKLRTIKVVLPHVGLVTFVCLYALVGAWVFHSLESPHEDSLKLNGTKNVKRLRQELTAYIWRHKQNVTPSREAQFKWKQELKWRLQQFNENLYRAYKQNYVRYGDIKNNQSNLQSTARIRERRHWSAKGRSSERGGKLWTASSSLFFAATTMATIGYGNIVPITNEGRIACIIFALFGAPLAIITIGDLGKFLSECTIWFYRKVRNVSALRNRLSALIIAVRRIRQMGLPIKYDRLITEFEKVVRTRESRKEKKKVKNNYIDEMDEENEVPVIIVFAILLIYIALGGILFAFLESWTYGDAFYYCFVSLTTIGFGDLVPERHENLLIMLIYLGVGLAVTTMCIDLVGIQYIQKIHYFGRKFKGTDILQILRRKRMLERRFAMGEGKDFIEFVIQNQRQENMILQPPSARNLEPPILMANQHYTRDELDEQLSLQSEHELLPIRLDDQIVTPEGLLLAKCRAPSLLKCPTPPPPKSAPPSTSTESPTSDRSFYEMYLKMERNNSWAESGPTVSVRCSLSTDASVGKREILYDDDVSSPRPSITSFIYSFPIPSPDLKSIGDSVRNVKRRDSCPAAPQKPPLLDLSPSRNELIQIDFEREPASPPQDPKPSVLLPPPKFGRLEEISEPNPATTVELNFKLPERTESVNPTAVLNELEHPSSNQLRRLNPEQYTELQEHWLISDALEAFDAWLDNEDVGEAMSKHFIEGGRTEKQLAATTWHSDVLTTALLTTAQIPCPLIKTPQKSQQEDWQENTEDEETSSSEPVFDLDLGGFELVDSAVTAEELLSNEDPVIYHRDIPVHSVHHDTVQTETAIENLMNAPASVLSAQAPPVMVADNYCFAVDGDRIQMNDIFSDDQYWKHTSRPTKYFYSVDLRRFYRVNCLSAKGRIVSARIAATKPSMGGASTAPEIVAAAAATAKAVNTGSMESGGTSFASRRSLSSPPLLRRSSIAPAPSPSTPSPSPRIHRRPQPYNPYLTR